MELDKSLSSFSKLIIAAALSSSSIGALAIEPAPVAMGPIDMIPTLGLGLENNSNIYTTDGNEQDSTILVVNPELLFKAQDRLNTYQARVYLNSGTYFNDIDGSDDYLDYGLLLDSHWEFTVRNKLDMYLSYEQLHDNRGSGFTDTDPFSIDEPDKYDASRFGAAYEYGLRESFAASIEAFTYNKDYKNNLIDPNANGGGGGAGIDSRVRNYRQNEVDLTAYFGVAPKTSLFFEVDFANYNYEKDIPLTIARSLDSEETRAYIGVEWDASAQFNGRAKIGQSKKDFNDSGFDDASTVSWEIAIDYLPTEIDMLTFNTGSNFQETEAAGAATKARTASINWNHIWLDRLSSNAGYNYQHNDQGQSPNPLLEDRIDKINTIKVDLTYNFRRWMDIGMSLQNESRSSNRTNLDYTQNIVMLNLDLSL